jgi:hypothetical protein
MPRLPDAMDLPLPTARSGRGVATFDTSAVGRAAEGLGQSIAAGAQAQGAATEKLAGSIGRVGDVALNWQNRADDLNEAKAISDLTVRTAQLDHARDDENDPEKLNGYRQHYQDAVDTAASAITDPRRQELFKTKYAPLVEKGGLGAVDRSFKVQQDASLADTQRQLTELQDAGLKAKDEPSRKAIIMAGQNLINTLEKNQYISKESAEKTRQQWVQGYAIKSIQSLPPEERINLLRPAPQSTDQILDRIGNVESGGNPAARASTSSAMGTFQFTKGTWAQTIADARPDLAKGRSVAELTNDPAIQAMRADAALSRQMAGVLLSQNAAALKGAGIEATPGNLYLAHFLGAGDAIKALKADPNSPVDGVINKGSIDANQSVLAGKQVGTVVNWANRKMGGVGPKDGGVHDFIPEADKPKLLDHAEKEIAANDIDGQRAQKQLELQAKLKSDSTENDLLKDLYSAQPKTTVKDIVNNDNLTREAKERMIGVANRALQDTDKADKTYGKGFYDLYQKVHAPDGDPGKITDPGVLYQHVGPAGDLTVAGVDKLYQEIQARRTPEGVAEGEMKKQFLSTVKGQISGSDEGLHLKDPKGDQLYLKWLATALPAYDEAKKAGKTPAQLLNPDSPDYIGKTADQFKRPMTQWFADNIADPPKVEPAAFDAAQIKSPEALIAAYRTGKISRALAREISNANGWFPASAAPAVSVSQ